MTSTKWAATPAAVAIAASDDQTLTQVKAGTNTPITVVEVGVSFDGSAVEKGFEVRIVKQSTDGTATGLTLRKLTGTSNQSVQATAGEIYTVEATDSEVFARHYVSPNSGKPWIWQAPDDGLVLAGGERIAIRVTAPSGITTVNAYGHIHFTE